MDANLHGFFSVGIDVEGVLWAENEDAGRSSRSFGSRSGWLALMKLMLVVDVLLRCGSSVSVDYSGGCSGVRTTKRKNKLV